MLFRSAFISLACASLAMLPGAASHTSAASEPNLTQSAPAPDNAGISGSLTHVFHLTKDGKYAAAEKDLRAFLQQDLNSADAHFLLGYVLYREQHPKSSLAEYTAGARIRKPKANDLAVVAMDYILLRDYTDADKWLTLATHWEPSSFLYLYYLGRTKYNEAQYQQAADIFKRALLLQPKSVRAEYNLGLSYAGLNQEDAAVTAYKTAILWERGSAHPDPQPFFDLGHVFLDRGNYQQAAVNLEKAVSLDPENPRFHEFLGQAYEFLGRLKSASTQMEDAIEISPNISALHFQLGRIYQKEGLTAKAGKEFARCSALQGTHSTDTAETPNPVSKK